MRYRRLVWGKAVALPRYLFLRFSTPAYDRLRFSTLVGRAEERSSRNDRLWDGRFWRKTAVQRKADARKCARRRAIHTDLSAPALALNSWLLRHC
jgi:hypothetical protein